MTKSKLELLESLLEELEQDYADDISNDKFASLKSIQGLVNTLILEGGK